MADTKDLAARIIALRADVQKAQQLRATSEANLSMAKSRLSEIDQHLKDLGLDPENCDVELQALEAQLDKTVGELHAKVSEEIGQYNTIVAATKQAFGQ